MTGPGIVTGGDNLFYTRGGQATTVSQGVFATLPGATLKYALNDGTTRKAEYCETMARLFVTLPASMPRNTFLESLPEETRKLGRVLAVGGEGAAGAGEGMGFIDFLMTNANERFQEKEQIVDTLTDNYVAFYSGQEAPLFTYSGMVLNTYQDDQRVWMLKLYRDILRGTRLANRGLLARLRYDSFIVSGYMTGLQFGLTSDTQMAATFTFGFRVKSMVVFTPDLGTPTILQTPATSNALVTENGEPVGATDRVATEGPETAPTATQHPGATGVTGVDPREWYSGREIRSNPENAAQDGAAGQTNVLGVLPSFQVPTGTAPQWEGSGVVPSPSRTSRRNRGVVPNAPTSGFFSLFE